MELIVFFAAFFLMEFVAWFTHKYVMHGFLWVLHESHHKPRKGPFELNDLFFLYFASLSMIFIVTGFENLDLRFFAGLGIMAYGFTYFIVHDVFIHQRFKWFGRTQNIYLKALRKAHYAHHVKHSKDNCESFGMLVVAPKFFQEVKKQKYL